MAKRAAIILAAGLGTRMKSARPKVLHAIGGRAMVDWSIDLAERCGCERIIVVTSPSATALQDHVGAALGPDAVAVQDPPLGTGHAVRSAESALGDFEGEVVVLYGDTPLVRPETVDKLFGALETGASVGVLGFEAAEPGAYGRLIHDVSGDLQRIVEAKDATTEELSVTLCNSGVLACASARLFSLLARVKNDNAKAEYYLTDVVGLARKDGGVARTVVCDESEVMGVNSRSELARCELAFQKRQRAEALESGVTLVDPDTVYFSFDTRIAPDCLIEPNVFFGPGVVLSSGAVVRAFSHITEARIASGAAIGPFAKIRGGAEIEEEARVGAFVEVKATRMGRGAKANHLAYLGDGDVGAGVNVGAGVIFCNYDGFDKHRTIIGDGAFIGSNASLVAPVEIGAGAYVGSGSVITETVEPNALALGRSRQENKADWAANYRGGRAQSDKKDR